MPRFSKKKRKLKKHILRRIPISMSCEIAPLQNKNPHHPPLAWKTMISVNLEDGIFVQDGGRQQQGSQQVLKTTAPNYATHEHFICVGAGFGSHGSTRNAPKQTGQHLEKKQQQHFELRNRLAQINRGVTTHTTNHKHHTTNHTTHPTPLLKGALVG